jgi:hypothetical protein
MLPAPLGLFAGSRNRSLARSALPHAPVRSTRTK